MPGGEPLCSAADLHVGSRRLPGITLAVSLAQSVGRVGVVGTRRERPGIMANRGLFPGAACCLPIELPHDKAAPLQAFPALPAFPYFRTFFAASTTSCSSSAGIS